LYCSTENAGIPSVISKCQRRCAALGAFGVQI